MLNSSRMKVPATYKPGTKPKKLRLGVELHTKNSFNSAVLSMLMGLVVCFCAASLHAVY